MAYSLSSVTKGASIFTIGQILTKASGFLLIPLYSRFLTPADYGIIGYTQVFVQVLSIIFMLGLFSSQSRYYFEYREDKEKLGDFLFSINAFLLGVLLLAFGAFSLFGSRLYPLFGEPEIPYAPYIPIVIWTVFFQILNQMVTSYYLVVKEFKKSALMTFLQFVMMTAFVIYFVVARKEGVVGRLKGELYSNVAFCLVFYTPYLARFARHRFSAAYLRLSLAFGFPIVLHLLAGTVHQLIDRVILKRYVTMEELGIYTVGYTFGMVMSVIVGAINQAWSPNYFELMKGETPQRAAYEVRRVFALWLTAIGGLCLTGMLWARELITLLLPKSYLASSGIVPIILFGYFMQGIYFFAIAPVFYYKKTRILPYLTTATAGVNIACNFLLIPRFGIAGAAYATVISFTFQALTVYLIGVRLFDPGYERAKVALVLLFLVLVLGLKGLDGFTVANEAAKGAIFLLFAGCTWRSFGSYLNPILGSCQRRVAAAFSASQAE